MASHYLRKYVPAVSNYIRFNVLKLLGQDKLTSESRAAVGLMRSLSNEFSSFNITFNTIAIGLIDTEVSEKISIEGNKLARLQPEPQPAISMKRPGKPAEVAAQVVFLASDRASYVSKLCRSSHCKITDSSFEFCLDHGSKYCGRRRLDSLCLRRVIS